MQVTHLPYHLFLIFTGAVVFSVVVQAAVFVGLFLTVRRATMKLLGIATQLSEKAGPIVEQVGGIVKDAEPKIRTIASQVVEISTAVRDQTIHVNETVDEVVNKTQAQADKVDEMVSAVLGGLSNAGSAVQAGVLKPARKVGGILQGLRVGVETFFRTETTPNAGPAKRSVYRTEAPIAEYDDDAEVVEEDVPVVADPTRKSVHYVTQPVDSSAYVAVHDDLPPLPPHSETPR
jgi:uncharacterized protein YoxC